MAFECSLGAAAVVATDPSIPVQAWHFPFFLCVCLWKGVEAGVVFLVKMWDVALFVFDRSTNRTYRAPLWQK